MLGVAGHDLLYITDDEHDHRLRIEVLFHGLFDLIGIDRSDVVTVVDPVRVISAKDLVDGVPANDLGRRGELVRRKVSMNEALVVRISSSVASVVRMSSRSLKKISAA